jgi:hypothetical protein
MLSIAELQRILVPHHDRLGRCVWPIWEHYKVLPEKHRLAYDQKAEANILQRYMVENAMREFSGIPGIQFVDKYEFLLGIDAFPFGLPGQVLCRFKRLSSNGHSRNFPTERAKKLRKNDPETLELVGMPEATVVDVGYVLDGLRTGIGAVQVIRLFDERFVMGIPREKGGVVQLPHTLPMEPGKRFVILARTKKGKEQS